MTVERWASVPPPARTLFVAVVVFVATLLVPAITPLWILLGVLVLFGAVMAAWDPRRPRGRVGLRRHVTP